MFDGLCSCEIDYDPAEFWLDEWHTARKVHRCAECNHHIRPGDRYWYARGKWDGRFEAFHVCVTCKAIGDDLACGGWWMGGLYEMLNEHYDGPVDDDDEDDWDEDWMEPGPCQCAVCKEAE